MPPRQRCRHARASAMGTLPTEVLLEIVARSDAATVFRCAAAWKLLRREITTKDFLNQLCKAPDGIVPPRLFGRLNRTFSLVHPATPAAASVAENHLAPFVSRGAADLLESYHPLTSRGRLVLLHFCNIKWDQNSSERISDMCVYDPMTRDRSFLPFPPDIGPDNHALCTCTYILLTRAVDDIGYSFLLLAVGLDGIEDRFTRCITVRSVSSDDGEWSPMTCVSNPSLPRCIIPVSSYYDGSIVISGVVHFLMYKYILTYDLSTARMGMIEFPTDCDIQRRHLKLGSTPDGDLRLFASINGFTLCFWVMSGNNWSQRADIHTSPRSTEREKKLKQFHEKSNENPTSLLAESVARARTVLEPLLPWPPHPWPSSSGEATS
ncbi:hypothetical protein QOZ80_2AG0118890 [Eleusine coracana subsp. coracana]|nr:hypothetical protein QOZ80_2AG0118890 [Eleusine coracana subsp. coracana]